MYICSLDAIRVRSSSKTQLILIEMRGAGGPTMSLDDFEFLFFESAGKASKDVETFLNLRFIKKQKSAVFFFFFEKIFYANKLKVKNVSLNVPDLL